VEPKSSDDSSSCSAEEFEQQQGTARSLAELSANDAATPAATASDLSATQAFLSHGSSPRRKRAAFLCVALVVAVHSSLPSLLERFCVR